MKFIVTAILCLCFTGSVVAQNASLAKIKLEEAQKAFLLKDYINTLAHLSEAETHQGALSEELLYLRVMAQNGLVEKDPLKDFQLLAQLQKNSRQYLDDYQNLRGKEERYKHVYLIWDKFGKSWPANEQQYQEALTRAETRRLEHEKIKQRHQKIKERIYEREEERRIKREEFEKIRKQRTFGYVAFRAGLAVPLSSKAKSNVTLDEYLSSGGYSLPFSQGRFGLKSGFAAGIHGIAPLEFLNATIQEGSLHPTFGFGLSVDLNQTLLRYDWKDLDTGDNNGSFLFRDAKYSNFGITSVGIGPAVCFRPSPRPMFVDIYIRPDLSLVWGGKYYLNTFAPNSKIRYEISTERTRNSLLLGTSLGVNFRYKLFTAGVEARTGLKDRAVLNEQVMIANPTSQNAYIRKGEVKTPGLALDYACFRVGLAF